MDTSHHQLSYYTQLIYIHNRTQLGLNWIFYLKVVMYKQYEYLNWFTNGGHCVISWKYVRTFSVHIHVPALKDSRARTVVRGHCADMRRRSHSAKMEAFASTWEQLAHQLQRVNEPFATLKCPKGKILNEHFHYWFLKTRQIGDAVVMCVCPVGFSGVKCEIDERGIYTTQSS